MIQYPITFKVLANGEAPVSKTWLSETPSSPGTKPLGVAVPPEFDGPGGGYSPEDFYALALMNCFVATFKVIAEKSKLSFSALKAEGLLTVDRGEGGAPWMKSFHLKVSLAGVGDAERARRLLDKTSQSCMILNSVKTEKTFEFEFI
jgi:organic hydroperoxide reductase OsmC/OhrA